MNFKIEKPFDGDYRITQKFGAKYLYFGKALSHEGLDFACPNKTPILAAHDGTIIRARMNPSKKGYGNEVLIEGINCVTQYAHLSAINVEVGERVFAGETIGHSGNSGFTLGVTGFHLHFGVSVAGVWVDPEILLVNSLESEIISEKDETPVETEKSFVERVSAILSDFTKSVDQKLDVQSLKARFLEKFNKIFGDGES
jgi:murein DD-endopeptidase MepM/ murein hydrolase activator NlpD